MAGKNKIKENVIEEIEVFFDYEIEAKQNLEQMGKEINKIEGPEYDFSTFCDIKGLSSRIRFVLQQLYKKEKYTIEAWNSHLKKHGLVD